jgi:flavorubredoxin
MATELYNDGKHVCLMYSDLVDDNEGEAVQANQFMVIDNGVGALIDPGGNMTYHALYMGMAKYFPARKLDLILASHADPDIVASLNKWMVGTESTLLISRVWARFVPHFCGVGNTKGRIVAIPDEGGVVTLGQSKIMLLPAHFLHSEGNIQFYDPVSKILFSGDMGASLVSGATAAEPVTDFAQHLPTMEGFHRRYMVAGKVCRYWAAMVRQLDIEWMVPQHGRPFRGKRMINQFLDWIEELPCGVDLMTAKNYQLPSQTIAVPGH